VRNTGSPKQTSKQDDDNPRHWRDNDSVINSWILNPANGDYNINPDLYDTLFDGFPIDFYHLIVDQNIIINIFTETNKYAQQMPAKLFLHIHVLISGMIPMKVKWNAFYAFYCGLV